MVQELRPACLQTKVRVMSFSFLRSRHPLPCTTQRLIWRKSCDGLPALSWDCFRVARAMANLMSKQLCRRSLLGKLTLRTPVPLKPPARSPPKQPPFNAPFSRQNFSQLGVVTGTLLGMPFRPVNSRVSAQGGS